MTDPKNNLFISRFVCIILFIILFDGIKAEIVAGVFRKKKFPAKRLAVLGNYCIFASNIQLMRKKMCL